MALSAAIALAGLENAATAALVQSGWVVDYIEVRHAGSLEVAHAGDKQVVILAAARLGKTRLIDNIEVRFEGGRIVEQGRHAALVARDGPYSRLHRVQFTPIEP